MPAHRHRNPDGSLGGWVIDRFWFNDIRPHVYGNAKVCGDAILTHGRFGAGKITIQQVSQEEIEAMLQIPEGIENKVQSEDAIETEPPEEQISL